MEERAVQQIVHTVLPTVEKAYRQGFDDALEGAKAMLRFLGLETAYKVVAAIRAPDAPKGS